MITYIFTEEDLNELLLRVDKNVSKYSSFARESMLQTIISFFNKHKQE